MVRKKFEYLQVTDRLLSTARAGFEKQIWDAFYSENGDANSREFRSAMFEYVFFLEEALEKHFQVGLSKEKFDLHSWKRRRRVNEIGQAGYDFEDPGGDLVGYS